jgi:pimeloyl-ACP methyl ester carboxylesterase
MEPRVQVVEHEDLGIGVLDWGGDGPPLLLLHPNGFCAGVFDPIAQRLRSEYRPIGVDVRGHGTSDAPKTRAECGYADAAADVLAALDALALDEVVVLGESLGGAAAILLDQLRPGIVRRALLCEAIAIPPIASASSPSTPPRDLPANRMVEAARRRRAVWPDRETVLASYGSRPPLEVFEPAALAGYVRWGFRDRSDGQVELACPPEVEAWYFEGGADGGPAAAFAHLASFSAPAAVVCGDQSDLPPAMFPAQANVLGVEVVRVPGTHFFLQEDTERAVALVREHLSW